uniref:Uncharacterized protein n=1 Tax=Panagrolaimus sp. JU765 TaxID=591449 RepID=A0AC34Q0G2_9BILA
MDVSRYRVGVGRISLYFKEPSLNFQLGATDSCVKIYLKQSQIADIHCSHGTNETLPTSSSTSTPSNTPTTSTSKTLSTSTEADRTLPTSSSTPTPTPLSTPTAGTSRTLLTSSPPTPLITTTIPASSSGSNGLHFESKPFLVIFALSLVFFSVQVSSFTK